MIDKGSRPIYNVAAAGGLCSQGVYPDASTVSISTQIL